VFCPRLRLNSQCARSNARRALATTGPSISVTRMLDASLRQAQQGRTSATSTSRYLFERTAGCVIESPWRYVPFALGGFCMTGVAKHTRSVHVPVDSARSTSHRANGQSVRTLSKGVIGFIGLGGWAQRWPQISLLRADVRSRRCTLRSLRIICSSAESRRAPHDGVDARDQLVLVERLGHVVIAMPNP
jgi:hypothetical protein